MHAPQENFNFRPLKWAYLMLGGEVGELGENFPLDKTLNIIINIIVIAIIICCRFHTKGILSR